MLLSDKCKTNSDHTMMLDVENQTGVPNRRKKTRRGKKRIKKMTFEDMESWTCSGCANNECGKSANDFSAMTCELSVSVAPKPVNNTDASKKCKKLKNKRIRPYNSPRAPHNSNQFLIEDRLQPSDELNDHDLCDHKLGTFSTNVGSFFNNNVTLDATTPEAALDCDLPSNDCTSPFTWKTSPAYSDVDFEYKTISESDMLTFQELDFEQAFQHAREEELAKKSKSELVCDVQKLEHDLERLRNDLGRMQSQKSAAVVKGHSDVGSLEEELRRLREENRHLVQENQSLTGC